MLRVDANHAHDALSLDNLAADTDFFDGWPDFHDICTTSMYLKLQPLDDPPLRQVVRTHLDRDPISWEQTDIMDAHLP